MQRHILVSISGFQGGAKGGLVTVSYPVSPAAVSLVYILNNVTLTKYSPYINPGAQVWYSGRKHTALL